MLRRIYAIVLRSVVFLTPGMWVPSTAAQDLPAAVCRLVIHDELAELEDARISVDLAKSSFSAYERIFKMIESLYGAETVPRMEYLKARYDRDAAKLELESADLILERQESLVQQYRLICGGSGPGGGVQDRSGAVRGAYLKYRRADCNSLAKTIDAASTKLEYYREYLARMLDLRKQNFATHTQVILAELDVEQQEKSLADARRRTATCRAQLADLDGGDEPQDREAAP